MNHVLDVNGNATTASLYVTDAVMESEFVLVNVAGESKVRITDGTEEMVVKLDKPMMGVYIPKMLWKDMYDFSKDSVLLVLANTHYDGSEYIRDYEEYLKEMKDRK